MPNQARSLAEELLEAAPDAIFLVRSDGHIALANPMAERMFGYARSELVGHPIELLIPADSRAVHAQRRQAYEAQPSARKMGDRSLYGQRKDGVIISVEVSLSPMRCSEGAMTIAIVRDVSERIELERRLRHASTHDALTGLYNRTHLDSERARLESEGKPLGVMLVDVDGLKPVNDQLGHEAGDEVLRRTAEVLVASSAPEDVVVRLGGDEFAIVRPHCSHAALAQMDLDLTRELSLHNQGYPQLPIALSWGTALSEGTSNLAHAMSLSDQRMYEQKRSHASTRPPSVSGSTPPKK